MNEKADVIPEGGRAARERARSLDERAGRAIRRLQEQGLLDGLPLGFAYSHVAGDPPQRYDCRLDTATKPLETDETPNLADEATAALLLPLARRAYDDSRLSVGFMSSIAAWVVTFRCGEDPIESYVSDTEALITALEHRAGLVSL